MNATLDKELRARSRRNLQAVTMSPLFAIGEKRLAETAAEATAPNVLTFTTDKAKRKREAARLANWRRKPWLTRCWF